MLNLDLLRGELANSPLQFTLALVVPLVLYRLYQAVRQRPVAAKAPPLIPESLPIFGSLRFFTARWDFFRDWVPKFPSFSFFVGSNHVVAITGDAGRAAFFDSRELDFGQGYFLLTGQEDGKSADGGSFNKYFSNRLTRMLRGGNFVRNLPSLIDDVKKGLGALGSSGITNPFDSVYEIVFQLTMRTVGCTEVADDPILLAKTMRCNQTIEQTSAMEVIMFPWLPSPALIRRTIAGASIYRVFDKIVKNRRVTGKRGDDALQFLIDQNDSVKDIISLVVGSLFAGLLNSGVNAAWILVYLATNPEWMARVREEVVTVAAKHCADEKAPLIDQLSSLPIEVWETGFPLIDLCLRDSVRLQTVGAAMRKNVSGHDLQIGDAVVPNGSFAVYHLADIHHDPEVYRDSEKWDPGRYLPDRAEDKKKPHAYLGWGAGRHPCLGMRFARLENSIITAFWLAMFDYELVDANGNVTTKIPEVNINGATASKPKGQVHLKYTARK